MTQRFGRYELLRPLGRGGMAETFVARYRGPEGFEKRLVIKRVLPSRSGDRRFLRLFFDEARTQVSLSHGNLVPVFDFGRVGNSHFIAMEYVTGCDLATLQKSARARGEPLGPRLCAYLGAQLCRGLGYVHRRGFVHRDVAPRNVLLSTDGEVKLSDFGVALATESEAAPGVRGTVAYMAPEQARGERPDGRADLFALGIVLAESLTLKRLRDGGGDGDGLAAARDPSGPITVEGPLAAIVARATAPDPAQRFPDAEAMLVAIEEAARSLGGSDAAEARALGVRVAAAREGSDDDAAPVTGEGAEPAGEAAYFRDAAGDASTVASFVDDVLAAPPVTSPEVPRAMGARVEAPATRLGRRASRRWWIAGAAALTAGAAVALIGRPSSVGQQPRAVRAAPAPLAAAVPPVAAPAPAAAPKEQRGSRSHSNALAPTGKPPAAAPTGTLAIYCTPWCVPFVDERQRGEDGRQHLLVVRAGSHRVSARRLDDDQSRTVEVRPGEARRVEFTFE